MELETPTTAQIKPQKVLVTGANGFIGRALMAHFQSQAIPVIGVDLTGDGSDVLQADIAQPETIADLLGSCDVVVHTAALVSNGMSDSDMWRVNVLATSRLARAAREHGVRRFVHISSIVAYGNDARGELHEQQPVHAAGGSYVLTKLASEHAVLAEAVTGDMEVVIVRPGDVYGPGSRPWIIIPLQAIRKNLLMLPARGEGFFRPVYIDDVIHGIGLASCVNAAANEIFNLSCPGYVSARDFFRYHCQWLEKSGPACAPTWVVLAGAALLDGLANIRGTTNEISRASVLQLNTRCWFAIDKAEALLGWRPHVSLPEGMERSRTWAADQGLL